MVAAFPSLALFAPQAFWVVCNSPVARSSHQVANAMTYTFSALPERFAVSESVAGIFTAFAVNRSVAEPIVLHGSFTFGNTTFSLYPTLSSAAASLRRCRPNSSANAVAGKTTIPAQASADSNLPPNAYASHTSGRFDAQDLGHNPDGKGLNASILYGPGVADVGFGLPPELLRPTWFRASA